PFRGQPPHDGSGDATRGGRCRPGRTRLACMAANLGQFPGQADHLLDQALNRKRWTPSPLISASLALHVGAAATVVARPGLWPWALGAVVADHLLLTGAG